MSDRKSILFSAASAIAVLLFFGVATAPRAGTDEPVPKLDERIAGQSPSALEARSDASKLEKIAEDASPKELADDTGVLYVLPKVGKPRNRVGGGRRGAGGDLPRLFALVPDHVGQTSSEQPVLYWYLSSDAPATVKFELTVLDQESIDPLVDVKLTTPTRSGLQRIALADHNIRLRPGEEYQWSVAIVAEEEDRSKDVVTTGWVEHVLVPKEIGMQTHQAVGEDRVRLLAGAGLWYDALDEAYNQILEDPGDQRSRSQFNRLLRDAELPESPVVIEK